MRLTQFSNIAIRVLMYAALRGSTPSPVPDMARAYGASYDHMKKAAAELARLGYLQTVRGRAGGVLLAKPPDEIGIGEVIRQTEGQIVLVECFDLTTNTCPLVDVCQLRVALADALAAFFAVLDRYTLADLLRHPGQVSSLLGVNDEEAEPLRRSDHPIHLADILPPAHDTAVAMDAGENGSG